jgi:4-amino-4-deoxy-L-arabinose transferase-like glycosyltransferase
VPQGFDVALFAFLFVWMLWGIGSYGLYEPHEAQYGGAAHEMVLRHDWVTPYLNGAPELNKPPLFYWIIAVSYLLLGSVGASPEFVARFPLVLISLSGAMLAWRWAYELFGIRAARYAATMLTLSIGWYMFAHQLLIDELLSTLIMLSLYALWKAIQSGRRWHWCIFYVVIGLAVLAKGLLGIIFPVMTLAVFILIRREWSLIRGCYPVMGFLLVSAVVGPWAYLYESHNPGALEYIVINEHFRRAFDNRIPHDYGVVQVSAFMFMFLTLVWLAPWSLLLPRLSKFVLAKNKTGESSASRDAVLLLTLGTVLPVLFFLLIPSRLIYYGLPALPPFMLLCAGCWSNLPELKLENKYIDAALFGITGVALLVLAFFIPNWLKGVSEISLIFDSVGDFTPMIFAIGAALTLAAVLIYLRKYGAAFAALAVLMIVGETYCITQFEKFDVIFSSKKLINHLSVALGDDCVWVNEGSNEVGAGSGMAYYLRQKALINASHVLIMEDDTRRPPPAYPGPKPFFLIDHQRLNEMWASNAPMMFVTDFARTDWDADPPMLPTCDCQYVPITVGGRRRVYANASAWKRLSAAKLVPAGSEPVAASKPEIVQSR